MFASAELQRTTDPKGATPTESRAPAKPRGILRSALTDILRVPLLGGTIRRAPPVVATAITITAGGLQHVMDRHVAGGAQSANKSLFDDASAVSGLISKASGVTAVASGPNMKYEAAAGGNIGLDRKTGKPTSLYTVITKKNGDLVTAFPGRP